MEHCLKRKLLTARKFDILALLIQNPNRVFTYEMIMELVWKEDGAFYQIMSVYPFMAAHFSVLSYRMA